MYVLGLDRDATIAKRVSRRIRATFKQVVIAPFPDGEHKITLPRLGGKTVVIVKTMMPANDALIDLIFTSETCRELGVKKIIFVCPYLGYMRQDKRFHVNEVISAPIMGKLLSRYCDVLITIDPHLHRIKQLSEVFSCRTKTLSANKILADYINKKIPNGVIIGPDIESSQWDAAIAKMTHISYRILHKVRKSSYNVKIKFDDSLSVTGKNVIIVDDIISTGRTLLKTIKHIKQFNPRGIYCLGVHGLLIGDAAEKIRKTGAKLICTNTLPNDYDKIDVSELIGDSILRLKL
ncbi:MAG: ribose-phosphate diphosphokinase [Candidatus Woesearchaeota archaeon]|jgi:ribose-phosphate pyrophosphokinase|nr:ribose-phosphate diphosphokinase [Candidatus Woesearchaeota archaeon]MDP7457789.1 ribose-phosphate diphosphokinase [Candidatus Woesearchaeota archaeon]